MSCGGNCRCACGSGAARSEEVCATPKEVVVLDSAGKCPCGKELKDCCHKDAAVVNAPNEALEELCTPTHGAQSPCGDEMVKEKTA